MRLPFGRPHYFRNQAVGVVKDGLLLGIWGTQQDITAEKLAQNALIESEERLGRIVAGANLGTWDWEAQTAKITVNEHWAAMLGYDLSEAPDHLDAFISLVHPDDRDRLSEVVRRHFNRETEFFELEIRLRAKNGEWKWIYDRGQVLERDEKDIPLKASGVHIDITERKKAELALVEREALLKAILNALPDLKFRLSATGVYLDYYASGLEDDQPVLPGEKLIGQSIQDVLPPEVATLLLQKIKLTVADNQLQQLEYALPVAGQIKYYEARISAINAHEVITVVRNITDRVHAAAELKEKVQELDVKNRQLKKYIDSNMQLENFAYIASHDLREPVRTMRSFAQMLQRRYRDKFDENGSEYLQFIVDSAENMNHLIEDLLAYSRINTTEHQFATVDPRQVIEKVLSDLTETIEREKAVIHVGTLPAQLIANRTKMGQLFLNLIGNAIKFHRPGIPPVVTLSGKDAGRYWHFSVEDNGIGIKPDYYDKIFLLFKKLHSRQKYQGTGLGLAICKKIVEQHEGDIWVQPSAQQGSTFHFTLAKTPSGQP